MKNANRGTWWGGGMGLEAVCKRAQRFAKRLQAGASRCERSEGAGTGSGEAAEGPALLVLLPGLIFDVRRVLCGLGLQKLRQA